MFRFPTVFFGSLFVACMLLFIGLTEHPKDLNAPLTFDVDIPSLIQNAKNKMKPSTKKTVPKVIPWNQNNSTENFCVWFNFTKATKESTFRSISLCTHGSIGYSKFVFDHAQNWDNRISVALLVDSFGFTALKTYLKLHKCMKNASAKVSTHLVWKPENETCSTAFILDGLAEPSNDTEFSIEADNCNVEDHIDNGLFNHSSTELYWPNTLRNVAREGSGTELHLIADIENHFSLNASTILLEAIKNVDKKSKIAVIVRRFEYNISYDEPRTIKDLHDLCKIHEANQFHRFFYAIGHSIPGLPQWFKYSLNASAPPILSPVNYRHSYWEPQLLVHSTAPYHFEGFSMKRDQCALPYELCRGGYTFAVASHVFSFHKGIKIYSTIQNYRYRIGMIARRTSKMYREYLDAKYGNETIKICKKW